MTYLSTFEVGKRWNLSPRRVAVLCAEGRIEGALRAGKKWIIPEDADKPKDARCKARNTEVNEPAGMYLAESQNTEWKESWRDEYLKWICGFANAKGGKIYIGKNDAGVVVGVPNAKRLLEDIPNKIRDTMGITADVNLCQENGLDYLEIVKTIFRKYLKCNISYEDDKRIETFPYSRAAVREAIINALVHNVYMDGVPIQIRISNDDLIISNSCILPEGWNINNLTSPHKSIPFNPTIADVFYRAGYIEKLGRGIAKIYEGCREIGAPDPEYSILGYGISVRFPALQSALFDVPFISNR